MIDYHRELIAEIREEYFNSCKLEYHLVGNGLQISITTEKNILLNKLIKLTKKYDQLIIGIRIVLKKKSILIIIICSHKP
jgi:hypothetical protein